MACPWAPVTRLSAAGRWLAKRAVRIVLNTATPSAEPNSRVVLFRPELTPAWLGGSEWTIIPDSNGIASPIPPLTTASSRP